MKTSPIRHSLFAASAILLLAGCVKMPKPGTQNPEEPTGDKTKCIDSD